MGCAPDIRNSELLALGRQIPRTAPDFNTSNYIKHIITTMYTLIFPLRRLSKVKLY